MKTQGKKSREQEFRRNTVFKNNFSLKTKQTHVSHISFFYPSSYSWPHVHCVFMFEGEEKSCFLFLSSVFSEPGCSQRESDGRSVRRFWWELVFNVCPKRFVVIHRQRLVSTQQNVINRGILMTFIRCVIRRKKKNNPKLLPRLHTWGRCERGVWCEKTAFRRWC